jgi:DNA-binding transcriptional regulator YbjK
MNLQQAIQDAQEEQYKRAVAAEEDEQNRQQRRATIVGYDAATGQYFVSEGGSGAMRVRSLTNASLPVGAIVSYFREGSGGFVDAIGSG